MYKQISFFILFLFCVCRTHAQVFDVDTLQYQGSSCINFVIMGDGYTLAEQPKFVNDANRFKNYFFDQPPYVYYKNYFNVFVIKVPSTESGVKHPHTANDCPDGMPAADPNNYFGSTFDRSGIHRLVAFSNTAAIGRILSRNFPLYDQVVVLANSNYYGGSGGTYPVATVNAASNEIAVHEIGHSFGNLADEYWAGAGYGAENANRTQEINSSLVKWKNWLGTNGIGIYNYGGKAPLSVWYRPHEDCKMQYLGRPFCSVCTEAIIERIHSLVHPIISLFPADSSLGADSLRKFSVIMVKPQPNTLQVQWTVNGQVVANGQDSIAVTPGLFTLDTNTVILTVMDTSHLLRTDEHFSRHSYTVSWKVTASSRPLPAPRLRWNPVEACMGTATVVTIANPLGGVQYNWYGDSTGTLPLARGTNFITPAVTGDTAYFVEAASATTKSARTKVAIKALAVPAPPPPLVTGALQEIAYGHSTILRVSSPDTRLNYRWYAAETGVRSMGEDTLMMTPGLVTTTSYYVASVVKETGCVSLARTKVAVFVKPEGKADRQRTK